jgi:hypothetical protein
LPFKKEVNPLGCSREICQNETESILVWTDQFLGNLFAPKNLTLKLINLIEDLQISIF